MKTYFETKFQETEIGKIPKDWNVKSLGDNLVKIKTGKLNSNAENPAGKYLFFTCAPKPTKTNTFSFDEKAILLAGNNASGNFHLNFFEGKFDAYQRTYVLSEITEDLKFLFFSLKPILIHFKEISQGTSTKFLTIEILNKLKISLPPTLIEQKNIAKILSDLDGKIEINKKINENLEEMGKAIFKQWFVDFEFPNDKDRPYKLSGGKMKYSEELEKEIPDGWEVGNIVNFIDKKSITYRCNAKDLHKNGNTPILDQGESGIYGFTNRDPDFIANTEEPVLIFTNHTCNYRVIDFPFCAIQNVLPLKAKNNFDEYFLYFLIKGSVKFSEYKGHWPELESKIFVIPPKKTRDNFSRLAKAYIKKISGNQREVQKLQEIRDYLLPRLMKGEIRIKD